MRSTSVHLPASVVEGLDRLAAERGLSRNRLIVLACERLLDADRGDWPADMFDAALEPDDLRLLREAGVEMEDAILAARRDRASPVL
ncbi:MAG: ribbon-helix-helix protein, CopG family [Alphaproteobacteria bacterium]|nr:ribbon-helix-helix protein, CopG family [Alphaproteobacteria bacterium]